MSSASRARDRAQLEREVRGAAYRKLLEDLRDEHPFLSRFATWEEVAEFIRSGGADFQDSDRLLRPILTAHGRNPRYGSVLLLIFWPALESLHRRKAHWDPDPERRWQNTVWAFLEVVSRIDAGKRRERLSRKLYADTACRLYRACRRRWRHERREVATAPETLAEVAGVTEAGEFGDSVQEARSALLRRYEAARRAGWISEADFRLLVATRVRGRSIADYCRATGLGYACARQRRSRAEAVLRARGKKS